MTDSTLLSKQNDPFHQVIDDLNEIAGKVGRLVEPTFKLDSATTKAYEIALNVDDLFIAVDEACKALKYTQKVCSVLTPIPVVGEIASAAANILKKVAAFTETIYKDLQRIKSKVVDKAKAILDKVCKGVDKVQTTTTEITNDIPNYTNTVTILDCLMRIAQPLAEVLKGNEAADRLDKLVDTYNKIKESVLSVISPLAKELDKLVTIVPDFVQLLESVTKSFEHSIGEVIDKIKGVAHVLSPIKDAMHSIEEAIAPVKWALDASECVFDKVFKPVIDEVLKVTGLQTLVDRLQHELEEKLGITNVIKKIDEAFKLDEITNYGSNFDLSSNSSSVSIASNQWILLVKTLDSFSQNTNQGTKQAVNELIGTIIGTPIDPDKPAVIPDWPAPPRFNTSKTTSRQLSTTINYSKAAINALDEITSNPQTTEADEQEERELLLLKVGQSISVDDSWQGFNNLKELINNAKQQLQQLLSDAGCLQNNLNAFQKSLSVPATFGRQLADLEIFLKTGSDAFHLIASLDIFQSILEPVAGILTNQVSECEKINAAIPQLKTAVVEVSESVQPVIQHTPTITTVENAINSLNGWSKGADSLVRLVEAGNQQNPNAEQQKQLAECTKHVNEKCDVVTQTVQSIIDCATDISKNIKGINDSLLTYANALKVVTQHDQLISDKALPTANKIAQNLKTLDSIFGLFSELLQQLNCVDASNRMKIEANISLTTLREAAKSTGSSLSNTLVNLLNDVAEKVLPIGRLNKDVDEATQKLNKDVVAILQSQSQQLVYKLDQLTSLLAVKYECTYKNEKDEKVSSPNQFVESKDVTAALSLISSFN